MPKQEPLKNVDSWLFFIPILPLWIWLFYRIEKLRLGIAPMAGGIGVNIVLSIVLPYPLGFVSLVVAPIIPLYFHRNWLKEWNKKFE